jgi:hypothetical protein
VVIQNQERYERAQKKLQPSSSLLDAESGYRLTTRGTPFPTIFTDHDSLIVCRLSVGPTTTNSTLDFALAKSPAYYIARKPRQVRLVK